MDNNISKIVEKFLSSLEKRVLDIQLQKEDLQAKNREYEELDSVIAALHESKVNFSIEYLNSETKDVANILERAIPDKEKLNFYLSQITNYYYLYETNLLDNEVASEQAAYSKQALDDLESDLKAYQSTIDVIRNRKVIKELEELEKRIISFGSKFGYVEENEEIEELDLFIELINDSRLSEEEKIQLLQVVITNNVASYTKKLSEKDKKIKQNSKQTAERETEEALDSLEELNADTLVASLDKDTLAQIEELLRNPEVIRRIVRVVEDQQEIEIDFQGRAYQEDLQATVDEAVNLAREEVIESLQNESASTPEEALNLFIEENDDDLHEAQVAFEEIFGEEDLPEGDKNIDEYLDIIQKGIEFYDQNKKLILDMTTQEKESIDNYARGLYKNKVNRTIIYKSKQFNGDKSILKDATYEIYTMLSIFKQYELSDKLTEEQVIYIGKRISEILESVEAVKEVEVEQERPKNVESKGTIYFLEKGTDKDRTIYEEEIGIGSTNKGISTSYYKDLLFQLEQIENREQRRIPSIRPNNTKSFPYTRDFGVRLISSNRISTYYIPVGTSDAIIVGVRFIDTGDDYPKTLERRLKTYSTRIEELLEKASIGKDKEETRKYTAEIKRILSQKELNREDTTGSEMDLMFEVPQVEITPPKHI